MYYIVSLTHTIPTDKYITLWGPNNAGYHFSKQLSGLYLEPEKGYHDSEGNMPITAELADSLFQRVDYFGEIKDMIPNNARSWQALGVKMSRKQHGLTRRHNPSPRPASGTNRL